MTLQTSGAISLSQIQSEFGGSNPISMSEYYRDGSYVPSTITGSAGSWSSYTGTLSPAYYWQSTGSLYWNGTYIGGWDGSGTFSSGGYDYQRSSTSFYDGYNKFVGTISHYSVRRRTSGTTITVNSNVPTSGTISMNNFYGGRKT